MARFLMAEWCSIVCVCTHMYTHTSLSVHASVGTGLFLLAAFRWVMQCRYSHNAVMCLGHYKQHCSEHGGACIFWVSVFIFLREIPRCGMAGSYGSCSVNFLGISSCFPHWLHQFMFPPRGSLFSMTSATLAVSSPFENGFCLAGVSWKLWFAFPWWAVILSILSGTLGHLRIFSGKMSIPMLHPVFSQSVLAYQVVWILHLFWILTPPQICSLQVLFPIQ